MNRLFNKVREFDGSLFRNIVSLRETEDLFDDLVEDSAVTAVAYATEIRVKVSIPAGKLPRSFHYSTAIGYPFLSEPFMNSRYGDGTFPVWYGAMELATSIHETVFHMVRNVSDIEGVDEIVERERAVYRVACQSLLIDLEGKQADYPLLISNSYDYTQEIGRRLHREGHPGLLAPSARHNGGLSSVIFNEAVLSDPQNHCYLLYRYDPKLKKVDIERSIGETMMTIQL